MGNSFALGRTLLVFIIPGMAPQLPPKRGCLWGEGGPTARTGTGMGTLGEGHQEKQGQAARRAADGDLAVNRW